MGSQFIPQNERAEIRKNKGQKGKKKLKKKQNRWVMANNYMTNQLTPQ